MPAAATREFPPLVQLGRWALVTTLGAFLLVVLPLTIRRFAASHVRPLEPLAMVVLAALCASLSQAARWWWMGTMASAARPVERWLVLLLPAVCLLLLGLAISSPGASVVATALVWLMILSGEALIFWRSRRSLGLAGTPPRAAPTAAAPVALPGAADTAHPLPEHTTQSILRTLADDGTDSIAGALRARFQPGERNVVVHVGFCPPLASAPDVSFEQAAGPEAEIKLARVYAHGARFDVRLRRAAGEAATVELAFHAQAGGEVK